MGCYTGCMTVGAHVWLERPPVGTVYVMTAAAKYEHTIVAVGFLTGSLSS